MKCKILKTSFTENTGENIEQIQTETEFNARDTHNGLTNHTDHKH